MATKTAKVETEAQHVYAVNAVSHKDLARIAGATHAISGAPCSIHNHAQGLKCNEQCYNWPMEKS